MSASERTREPARARAGTVLPSAVYLIGCERQAAEPPPSAETMGFKAWNLLRMAQLSLPVPPAFVIGTRYCLDAASRERAATAEVWGAGLHELERATGLVLGDPRRPLLVSVRSGAPVSMPGMMETLLNVGLCDATVAGLLRHTGNPRLVWDAYRRLVSSYGEIVAGVPARLFEEEAAALAGGRDERELDFAELRELARRSLEIYAQAANHPFPQDPEQQLSGAIAAVLGSWQSQKAREYRRVNGLSEAIGTAVTVQRMVFGNAGGRSGAGVGFTRDPSTGERGLWVDFLFNAQGEDVVSGRRSAHGHGELAAVLPAVWHALAEAAGRLESGFRDMQDFEFTVEQDQLFMLQTRAGKRTPLAAVRIALQMLEEELIDAEIARTRTAGLGREALAQPRVVAKDGRPLEPLARAASASGGVALGEIALDEGRARARQVAGAPVILVRRDADTSDIAALESALGLLTRNGARTSHAAVVARQLGKVCLVGCAELQIDASARTVSIGTRMLREGELLTLDGNEGVVYAGATQTAIEYPLELLSRLEALRGRT